MSEPRATPTWQIDEIRSYFGAHFRKPRWRREFKHIENSDPGISLGPVKINKLIETYRNWTFNPRCHFAAWSWLRPQDPHYTVNELPAIQKAAGLEHLEKSVFLGALHEQCREFSRQHPTLSLWIRKRISLLEFHSYSYERLPAELTDNAMRQRHALIEAYATRMQGPAVGRELADVAEKISQQALHSAAQAATLILGKRGCPISANLMIPAGVKDADGPRFGFSSAAEDNSVRATSLWAHLGVKVNKILVIVSETEGNQHAGFWVPLVRSPCHGGADIPGAPAAYFLQQGSAVFRDDLPRLDHFSVELTERWFSYLRDNVSEKLFVSLPFLMPSTAGGSNSKHVVAVLNVNADPHPEDGWYRAYHEPWLQVATAEVAQFVEIAFYATVLKLQALADEYKDVIGSKPRSWPSIGAPSDGRELPERKLL